MKISIIGGAGTLGATSAFVIAQQALADEICLIDVKENVAKSHEMDMGQAVSSFSHTKITSGGFEQLTGSDLVIITAGIPETRVSSRMEYLEGNLRIIAQISNHIQKYAPDAILITATNPVDVINSMLQHFLSVDQNKFIGFSLNDTYRFRWAIARVLGVNIAAVDAIVLGEHGDDQLPIFSRVFVNGEKILLSGDQKKEVGNMIKNWFAEYQALNSGRTSGWLSAINIARIVRAIVKDTGEILPCSAIGPEGISIGRPVKLGKNGIEALVDLELTKEEEEQYAAVKEKIMRLVASLRNGSLQQ